MVAARRLAGNAARRTRTVQLPRFGHSGRERGASAFAGASHGESATTRTNAASARLECAGGADPGGRLIEVEPLERFRTSNRHVGGILVHEISHAVERQ